MIKQRRPSLSLSLSPSPAPSPQLDVPVACLLLPTLSASVVAFVCVLFFFVLFRFLRFLARLARARVTYLFLQDLLSCSERRHGGLLMSHLQSQLLITPFLLSLSSLSLSLFSLSLLSLSSLSRSLLLYFFLNKKKFFLPLFSKLCFLLSPAPPPQATSRRGRRREKFLKHFQIFPENEISRDFQRFPT